MCKNPVTEIRESLGLSQADFSIYLGLRHHVIGVAERGTVQEVQRPLLQALHSKRYDAYEIAKDYRRWRAARAQEIANETKGKKCHYKEG